MRIPAIQATELLLQERVTRLLPVKPLRSAEMTYADQSFLPEAATRLPHSLHALSAGPFPLQRPLHDDRHQRRRRRFDGARTVSNPMEGGPYPGRREASSSTSATSAAGSSGPPPISPWRRKRRNTDHASFPRRRSFNGSTMASRRCWRSPSRPRMMSKSGGCRSPTGATVPGDRDHELRRARPGPGDGRPGPSGVREALPRNLLSSRLFGDPLRSAASRFQRSGDLGHPRVKRGRAHAGSGGVGDGSGAIPGPGTRPRRSRRAGWPAALRNDGSRARCGRQPPDPGRGWLPEDLRG